MSVRRLRHPRRQGQALVELALSLPLLMGVLVLVIEGTLMISAQQRLVDAVHQAGRSATETSMEPEDIRERIEAIVLYDPVIDPAALMVDVDYGIDSNGADNLTVSASLPVRPVTFTHLGTFRLSTFATYRIPADRDEEPS